MGAGDDVGTVALLREPIRRRLYDYVRKRDGAVGRDEAAAAVGVSRSLAAFHLDRLAGGGILLVEYRRLSGRSGPGAGRPAKMYRPASSHVRVSIPETRYELAGRLLASAVEERRPRETPEAAVRRVAARHGAELGGLLAERAAGTAAGTAADGPEPLEAAAAALAELGFEPERTDGGVLLRNCPFDELVRTHRPLICSMNHALVRSVVKRLGEGAAGAVRAEPRELPGYCCVALVAAR